MSNLTYLKLYTDGGSRGNPGPAAYGFVVYDAAGIILEKCGNYLGEATNNIAEYAGLISGLEWITLHHPQVPVKIFMDSLLVVNQVQGKFKVKNSGLLPKYQRVQELLARLPDYTISHTYREQNVLADQLLNTALNKQLPL